MLPNVNINTDKLFAYENGLLDESETIDLFQELLNTGLIHHLQGHYGRTAAHLIARGECVPQGYATTDAELQADNEVYAMHGMDDGPVPDQFHPSTLAEFEVEPLDTILDESGLAIGRASPLRKALDASHTTE